MINQISYGIRVLLVFLVSCSLTGCLLTESLLQKRSYTYTEEVESILLTEDKKTLVFLGKHHHYIFQNPESIIKTFQSSFYPSVRAKLSGFNVDKKGHITGYLTLYLSDKAPQDDRATAAASGFKCKTKSNGGEYCRVREKLQGMRYSAGEIPIAKSYKLNKTYSVSVESDQRAGAKLLLTPVTVAVDGVLVIAGLPLFAPLFAAYVGVMLAHCRDENQCK